MSFEPMTPAQSRHLHALLRSERQASGPERFPVLADMLGREISSTKEISRREATHLIDRLKPVFSDSDAF